MGSSVMIDLETLSLDQRSVIAVFCAVQFDDKTFQSERIFYRVCEMSDQIERGRTVDGRTIEWWLKQSQESREALMRDPVPLDVVLTEFDSWMVTDMVVWANGIDFDLAILRDAYKGRTPWHYWDQRDLRTVVKLSGIDTKAVPFDGPKHHAKYDCLHQIKLLRESLVKLGLIHE